jgi:hypothetical protein
MPESTQAHSATAGLAWVVTMLIDRLCAGGQLDRDAFLGDLKESYGSLSNPETDAGRILHTIIRHLDGHGRKAGA